MKPAHLLKNVLTMAVVLMMPISALSDSLTDTDAKGISASEFMQLLLQNHPKFAKESLNSKISQEDVLSKEAAQDWQLELSAQQAHQEELLPSFGPAQVNQSEVDASVGRQIWVTGAYMSVALQKTLSNNEYASTYNPAFPSPSSSDTQQVSVTFSQPLMKNFKGSQSRLAYDLSVSSGQISELQSLEAEEQFLQSMMGDYLDWRGLEEELAINKQRFSLAQEQAKEIKKRYDKNYVEKLDWLRAQDSRRMAEQQFLLSQSRFEAKTESLAHLSALPELLDKRPDFSLYDFPELPPLEQLVSESKKNTRNIRLLDLQQAQLQRQSESLKDETRPELNLDMRAAYKSESQDGLAPGSPSSDQGKDYSVGLNFKKQLGVDSSKSELRKIEYQLDQVGLDKKYAQMQMEANIRNLYIQLQKMRKILSLNEDLVKAAQQTTEEENRVYLQGRSDLTKVISSRDQTQNAKLQYAQNAINYHKLYLQLNSLTDKLLKESQE